MEQLRDAVYYLSPSPRVFVFGYAVYLKQNKAPVDLRWKEAMVVGIKYWVLRCEMAFKILLFPDLLLPQETVVYFCVQIDADLWIMYMALLPFIKLKISDDYHHPVLRLEYRSVSKLFRL